MINIRKREGAVFSDVIRMPFDGHETQLTVRGDLKHAVVNLPDEGTIEGTIAIVPISVESNMPARTYVFKANDGHEYPFGEEILSAGSEIRR